MAPKKHVSHHVIACDHFQCHVQALGEAALQAGRNDAAHAMAALLAASAIVCVRGCKTAEGQNPFETWMESCREAWKMAHEYDADIKANEEVSQ